VRYFTGGGKVYHILRPALL